MPHRRASQAAAQSAPSVAASTTPLADVAGLGAPFRRAVEQAGYGCLEELADADYATLLGLHGVGWRGLEHLQAALVERGLSLAGDVPQPRERKATFSAQPQPTGINAPDIKTAPGGDLAGFLASLDPRRAAHAQLLLDIFSRATGEEPVLWGPSMIGHGHSHYVYDTGREGDTFRVGFSPRKAKLTLYGLQSQPGWENLASRLGKHTSSVACVYVNKPEDIDLDVLEDAIAGAWAHSSN